MTEPIKIHADVDEYVNYTLHLTNGDFASGQRRDSLADVPVMLRTFAEGQECSAF